MVGCNVIAPLFLFVKRLRTRIVPLAVISFLVLVGMYLERYVIVISATAHDFMPENWSGYRPTWVELSIGLASLSWFLFWFLLYTKHVPVVAISESKEPQVSDRMGALA